MQTAAGIEAEPEYTVVPTLHGPLALHIGGELIVAEQGNPEANAEVARQAHARFELLREKA